MKIVGLCGYSGVGKSTFAKLISDLTLNIQIISTGDTVRRMMRNANIDIDHTSLQNFNLDLYGRLGERYISIVFEYIDCSSSVVIIDSLRTMADYHQLKSRFADSFSLIGINCDDTTRFDRMIRRSRPGDIKSLSDFSDLTRKEKEWGADNLLLAASVVITNNHSSTNDFANCIHPDVILA